MSATFIFQVETSASGEQPTVQIEGRCCQGEIRQGDIFTELLVRIRNDDGSFSLAGTRSVSIPVQEVTSIRPGLLGLGEVGTLKVDGAEDVELGRDFLLKGSRSG